MSSYHVSNDYLPRVKLEVDTARQIMTSYGVSNNDHPSRVKNDYLSRVQ